MVQIDAYEEDVAVMSGNLKTLEETLQEFDNTAQEIGLIITQEKKYDSK
jgi:hypothetical protein